MKIAHFTRGDLSAQQVSQFSDGKRATDFMAIRRKIILTSRENLAVNQR